jgi:TetR/AcrR family transcriptional repressor of bet genes
VFANAAASLYICDLWQSGRAILSDDGKPIRRVVRRKTAGEREDEIIAAAIAVIGSKGLSKTTLAEIAKKAGVGYGNLTFRFGTKDKLLVAALRTVLEEYTAVMEAAAAQEGTPAERLRRLITSAFDPLVTTRNKIALWNAFLSECHTRVAYKKIFTELREREQARTVSVCREILEQAGRSDLDAETVALGLNALVEGLWFNMRVGRAIDREAATRTALLFSERITNL